VDPSFLRGGTPYSVCCAHCFRATSEFCNRAAQGNEALKAVMMAVAAASSIGLQLSPWKTVKLL
jgi:hypothetical protein